MQPDEFKRVMIKFAHRHFQKNTKVILYKTYFADAIGILMALEAVFLTIWVIGQP
jgi:hypothetical protein